MKPLEWRRHTVFVCIAAPEVIDFAKGCLQFTISGDDDTWVVSVMQISKAGAHEQSYVGDASGEFSRRKEPSLDVPSFKTLAEAQAAAEGHFKRWLGDSPS